MNYGNPYAPPQPAPAIADIGTPPPLGAPQPWAIGEVMNVAWARFQKSWVTLVFTYLIAALIASLPLMIGILVVVGVLVATGSLHGRDPDLAAIAGTAVAAIGGGAMVMTVLSAFFQPALIRIWITIARGGEAKIGDVFRGGRWFFRMLGLTFVSSFVIGVGYALLVVPGVILAIGLFFAQFFLVEREMGIVDAMKASWEATKGHKGQLFLFAMLAGLIVGVVNSVVAILTYAVVPFFMLCATIVYLRLTGTDRPPAPPAYVPPPGPAGGFGGQ